MASDPADTREQDPEPAAGKVDATCAAPQNFLKALELEASGYTGNRGRLKRGWVESLEK